MSSVLPRITGPGDVRQLSAADRTLLCAEIRDFLVAKVAAAGSGHLGPNLGVVELTVALHTVFDSPHEPILFDTGHQAYVHKILTGRRDGFDKLRKTGGLSGYPSRAESEHDWIENSHASTALSWADGLSKAYALRGDSRPVVAVVGDGALTGGMCWEALNNIAACDRPVVIVVNDNGWSYSPTIGGLTTHLSELRLRPGYEKALTSVREALERTPVIGQALFDALHGAKRGLKDFVAPQGMFEDLGLKYVGPIDGHDFDALVKALSLAKNFGGPVIVHAVTRKGFGYAPAENDEVERMHGPGKFDPETGQVIPKNTTSWTNVFSDEIVRIGAERDDVVAISAAMVHPVGLAEFGRRFPDRLFDVGIAEQHALTSAAGLSAGGMHPVVALYATFLNRALDQLLLDVALHKQGVTLVLERSGLTGDDGPSHNGVWDLAMLGMVPNIRLSQPRDEQTYRELLREAVATDEVVTVVRVPKTPLVDPVPSVRSVDGVDVLAEPPADGDGRPVDVDVLLISVGWLAAPVLEAAEQIRGAGFTVRVVDPRWVTPVAPALLELARRSRLVVTVEDGIVTGGVGARFAQALDAAGLDVPRRQIGVPAQFLDFAAVGEVRAAVGLTPQGIGRRVVEWAAGLRDETSTETDTADVTPQSYEDGNRPQP